MCICSDDDEDDCVDGENLMDAGSLDVSVEPSGRSSQAGGWKRIARVLDRFFFIIFMITVVLMAMLLHNNLASHWGESKRSGMVW